MVIALISSYFSCPRYLSRLVIIVFFCGFVTEPTNPLAWPYDAPMVGVSPPGSFVQGEQLVYSVSLLALPAGTAKMEVRKAGHYQGHPTVKLVTTAISNDFFSLFFPVNNRVESLVQVEGFLPFRLLFQRREGTRHEDFDVVFHREERTVTIVKNGQTTNKTIPENIHGPLSCLYFLRSLPSLNPGSSVMIPIHHDRKNYDVEVRIETVESMSGAWGQVEAIRVLVMMPFRGIFLNKGNIRIWLTNDQNRVPIMMKAKILFGSVVAKLVPDTH